MVDESFDPAYYIEDCRIRLEVASVSSPVYRTKVSREAKMHEKIDTV